jgi:hypothetical protein
MSLSSLLRPRRLRLSDGLQGLLDGPPGATLVTSRRPGPRPPRPWIRRPGQPAPPRRRLLVALKGSPDGIRDYAEGCAGDLADIHQRAHHDVGHRGTAGVHDVPRPLDDAYDRVLGLFLGRRSTWPSLPAGEEPATVDTIASNPPIALGKCERGITRRDMRNFYRVLDALHPAPIRRRRARGPTIATP